MANYNSNYEIAQEISARLGTEPIPFDSVYSICLQIYRELGGTDDNFDSVYSILLEILPLIDGGIANKVIDDTIITTAKTWSSSKINSELNTKASTDYVDEQIETVIGSGNSEIDGKETEDFTFVQTLPVEGEEEQQVIIKGDNIDTLYKYVSGEWVEQTPDATKLFFDVDNEALYSYVTASHQFAPVSMVNTIVVGSNNLDTSADLKALKTIGVYNVAQRVHGTNGNFVKNWTLYVESVDYEEYDKQDSVYQKLVSNYTIKKRTWSSKRQSNNGWTYFGTYYAGEIKDSTTSHYYTWSGFKIAEQIANAGFNVEIVQELPITGDTHTVYFMPATETDTSDIYDEYMYVDSVWEKIGSTRIDLSNYYTKTESDTLLATKQGVLTAGTNISISGNTISATDTTYVAGDGIEISGNTISCNVEPLQAGDNISIADGKINALGYSFKNIGFTEIPILKYDAIQDFPTPLEQVGLNDLQLTGDAGATTYTMGGTSVATMTAMGQQLIQMGVMMKTANSDIAKIASIDTTNSTITFENTLDANNALSNEVVTNLYMPLLVFISGAAGATTYTYISQLPLLFDVGDTVSFGNYPLVKVIGKDTSNNTVTFDKTLDENAAVSNAQFNYFLKNNNTASAMCSHAEGQLTTASNAGSHAEGSNTTASGLYSHAEGSETTASKDNSHAEGYGTTASGTTSHAEGNITTASGQNSHAEGNGTTASGKNSHAEGYNTVASNSHSHAEGNGTTASGQNSHAEGYNTVASHYRSHAEGYNTKASSMNSHAEGNGTTASAMDSHAEGTSTTASGTTSHAEGNGTIASGKNSHAEGEGAFTQNDNEHAEGKYNFSHTTGTPSSMDAGNTQHSVGIGQNTTNRQNAFEIMKNGDMYVFGVGGYQGTNTKVQDATIKTLQEYIASLETRINALEGNTTVE